MKLKVPNLGKSIFKEIKLSIDLLKAGNKMAKIKDNEYPHIDFENKVMYGVLKQIKHSDIDNPNNKIPKLVDVWSCKITPQQSKSFIQFIRETITPYDNQNFTHIKRLQKDINNNKMQLNGIVCSSQLFMNKKDLIELIHSYGNGDLDSITSDDVELVQIPSFLPATKEITDELSAKYWPMAWKGNQDIQFLKHVSIDIKEEKAIITKLLSALEEHAKYKTFNGVPVGTLIVDERKDKHEILVKCFDCRDQHPLDHSIMKGIQEIANEEKAKRSKLDYADDSQGNYLLNDLTVYTTHEPCVMCSMALVHSRIHKIVYLKPMKTGGLESNYQLGDRDDLNWKFQIWKWLDEKDLTWLDDIEHNYLVNNEKLNA